jgi:hypothetical protein
MQNLKSTVLTALQTASALSTLKGFDFHYPDTFNNLPRLSYFQADNTANLYADEEEVGSEIIFQIDLWGKASLSTYQTAVNDVMASLDFERISSPDLFEKDTKIHHIAMRFRKDQENPDF